MVLSRVERWVWSWALPVALVTSLAALAGCSPKIGDKCTVSTDCSVQGDRLCDPTQPGGYCTIFNCEPNRCPDEAVCVAFNEPSCSSPALSRRFQRTFCMAVCESDNDCRAGYFCIDTAGDTFRQVVDVNPQSTRICAVRSSDMMMSSPDAGPDPAVCQIPDSGLPPPDAGTDTSTEGASTPDAAETSVDDAAPDSTD
jgi:hypothetical protein